MSKHFRRLFSSSGQKDTKENNAKNGESNPTTPDIERREFGAKKDPSSQKSDLAPEGLQEDGIITTKDGTIITNKHKEGAWWNKPHSLPRRDGSSPNNDTVISFDKNAFHALLGERTGTKLPGSGDAFKGPGLSISGETLRVEDAEASVENYRHAPETRSTTPEAIQPEDTPESLEQRETTQTQARQQELHTLHKELTSLIINLKENYGSHFDFQRIERDTRFDGMKLEVIVSAQGDRPQEKDQENTTRQHHPASVQSSPFARGNVHEESWKGEQLEQWKHDMEQRKTILHELDRAARDDKNTEYALKDLAGYQSRYHYLDSVDRIDSGNITDKEEFRQASEATRILEDRLQQEIRAGKNEQQIREAARTMFDKIPEPRAREVFKLLKDEYSYRQSPDTRNGRVTSFESDFVNDQQLRILGEEATYQIVSFDGAQKVSAILQDDRPGTNEHLVNELHEGIQGTDRRGRILMNLEPDKEAEIWSRFLDPQTEQEKQWLREYGRKLVDSLSTYEVSSLLRRHEYHRERLHKVYFDNRRGDFDPNNKNLIIFKNYRSQVEYSFKRLLSESRHRELLSKEDINFVTFPDRRPWLLDKISTHEIDLLNRQHEQQLQKLKADFENKKAEMEQYPEKKKQELRVQAINKFNEYSKATRKKIDGLLPGIDSNPQTRRDIDRLIGDLNRAYKKQLEDLQSIDSYRVPPTELKQLSEEVKNKERIYKDYENNYISLKHTFSEMTKEKLQLYDRLEYQVDGVKVYQDPKRIKKLQLGEKVISLEEAGTKVSPLENLENIMSGYNESSDLIPELKEIISTYKENLDLIPELEGVISGYKESSDLIPELERIISTYKGISQTKDHKKAKPTDSAEKSELQDDANRSGPEQIAGKIQSFEDARKLSRFLNDDRPAQTMREKLTQHAKENRALRRLRGKKRKKNRSLARMLDKFRPAGEKLDRRGMALLGLEPLEEASVWPKFFLEKTVQDPQEPQKYGHELINSLSEDEVRSFIQRHDDHLLSLKQEWKKSEEMYYINHFGDQNKFKELKEKERIYYKYEFYTAHFGILVYNSRHKNLLHAYSVDDRIPQIDSDKTSISSVDDIPQIKSNRKSIFVNHVITQTSETVPRREKRSHSAPDGYKRMEDK